MRLAFICALVLAGCQASPSSQDSVAGTWASDDGVFVASFSNGSFSSRLVETGDTVVEDGRYRRDANRVALAWTSIATNEQRSAACQFVGVNRLSCTPSAGNPFTMTRTA